MLKGRYRPLRILGQGQGGRTLLAMDAGEHPPGRCVIQQRFWGDRPAPTPDSSPPGTPTEGFRAIAEHLRRLGEHPQIPRLLDFFEHSTGQYLVYEYIPGPNLEQVLRQGLWDEKQIRRLLEEILPVLQFIHDHGVIHRDIRPANLIIPQQPAPLVLVDFGSCQYRNWPEVSGRDRHGRGLERSDADGLPSAQEPMGSAGRAMGSAGYAAPEQVIGKAINASDLYSLGVTCIHLLTGLHPFDLYSLSEDQWIWRTFVQSPVSLKMARILDRLLARELGKRYASAAAVLADLQGVPQLGMPSQPQGRSPGGWLGRSSGRKSPPSPVTTWGQWQLQGRLDYPRAVVNALAVSPDGAAIATGASDQTVRLWDLAQGTLLHTFAKRLGFLGSGHQDEVTNVAFSPDNQILFSSGRDGHLKGWNLETDNLTYEVVDTRWVTAALVVTPDGRMVITAGGEGKIKFWEVPSGQLKACLGHHQDWVSSLGLSGDGRHLVSGSWDKTIRVWQVPSGRLIKTITAPRDRITALAVHPTHGWIFSGDAGGSVQLWKPQAPHQGIGLSHLPDEITRMAISPDGDWLAIGGENGQVQVWRVSPTTQVATLSHDWGIRAIAFAPDRPILVTSSTDETVRIWELHRDL